MQRRTRYSIIVVVVAVIWSCFTIEIHEFGSPLPLRSRRTNYHLRLLFMIEFI
jgi:hypothetical protein